MKDQVETDAPMLTSATVKEPALLTGGAQELPDQQKELDITTMKLLQATNASQERKMLHIIAMVQGPAPHMVGAQENPVDSANDPTYPYFSKSISNYPHHLPVFRNPHQKKYHP